MLKDEFPLLANFVGSWFPDADLEGLDDKEVVRRFVGAASRESVVNVIRELDLLLSVETLPFADVSQEANLFFDNEVECREWLNEIRRYLRSEVEKSA